MLGFRKKRLLQEYKYVEFQIQLHNKFKYSAFYFLNHIFIFLRENNELLQQDDYKELYEETVVLLILYSQARLNWTKKSPTGQQAWLEYIADLNIKNPLEHFEPFTLETVNKYLNFRKDLWEIGEKYTKKKLGFIS